MSHRRAERPPKPASSWAARWKRKMVIARMRWPVLRAALGPKDAYYAARREYRIAYRNSFGCWPEDATSPAPNRSGETD